MSGILNLLQTPEPQASLYALHQFHDRLSVAVPNFREHYIKAQMRATVGEILRRDMPVINEADLEKFKNWVRWEDHVVCRYVTMHPMDLTPLQRQIWVDKVIPPMAERGRNLTATHLHTHHIVVSSDGHIIDGHHRWLCGMLWQLELAAMRVPLSAVEVLQQATNYSNTMKHERNT